MNKILILNLWLLWVFSAVSCNQTTSKERCENTCKERSQLCFSALIVKDSSAQASNQSSNPAGDAIANCSVFYNLCQTDCKLKDMY
ncbi:LA_0364 family Cys-rich lipoprotein [Leptospira sanjuanensis]|uniref:LA_0364 family Cys-rich lipoprotein n=1 Tax=Leptospira sanjuanensis TaxID=2879643 RepID=UPI0038732895